MKRFSKWDNATPSERFWAKVEKTETCWLWAARKWKGYGVFNPTHEKSVLAHRFAYEEMVGPIPGGLTLDHLCRQPACVRPIHLEPVPLGENLRRAPRQVSTLNRHKTHCPAGHPYDIANTRVWRNKRSCRTCGNAARRVGRRAEGVE